MTTEFIHLDNSGTMVIHTGGGITASYRNWVHSVVLRYHENMTLDGISEAEKRMQELKNES